MPTDQSEIVERFALEGPASVGVVVAFALAIAALAAWLLWRERKLVGSFWAGAFLALRMTAIAIALWMLLGPTKLLITRLTKPQSIAVMLDSSASMDEIDPDMPADDLRWSLASSSDKSAVTPCDRAVVALAAALQAGKEISIAAAEHQPRQRIKRQAEAVRSASRRAAQLLEQATDRFEDVDSRLAGRSERLIALLEEPIDKAVTTVIEEATLSNEGGLEPLNEAAAELHELLQGAYRRSGSLAGEVALRLADRGSLNSGAPSGRTRRERAQSLIDFLEAGVLESLAEECQLRRFHFEQSVTPVVDERWAQFTTARVGVTPVALRGGDDLYQNEQDLAATAANPPMAATNLSAALETLEKLRASEPLKMAILITDGRHNLSEAEGAAPPQDVAGRLEGVPVHVVPLGVTKPVRDALIHRIEAPSAVVENDQAVIEALVTAFDCRGENLAVTLRRDGKEVDRKTIEVTRDRMDRLVTFLVAADELGWRQYEIEIEPISDEASLTNNLSAVAFEVVRDKIRVLLADLGPRYEYRYLQHLFRRAEEVEFDEYLTLPELRATGALEASGELPRTVEEWSRYEVVILGDLGREHLTRDREDSLAEYVRGGGNLIIIAGREHMPSAYASGPMRELVPVEQTAPVDPRIGFMVTLPDRAQSTGAVMIRDSLEESQKAWESTFRLAPIYGLSRYSRPKPTSQTLLEAAPLATLGQVGPEDRRAFLCWTSIGAGRVAYLAAPQSYLLRFRRGDTDHYRFWGQMLRWITASKVGAGSETVRLETNRTTYERGQPVEVTVWLSDKNGQPVRNAEFRLEARGMGDATVEIEMRPDGQVPGRYSGVFTALPIGAFEIAATGEIISELKGDEQKDAVPTLINVQATSGIELVNTQGNRPLLEQIAELTGGQVLPPTAVAEAFQLVSLDPEVTETTRRTPLWNRWSNLVIVLGCLFTEWVVRKRKGLT